MKITKILLIFLISICSFGQVSNGGETDFDYGIKNNAAQTVTVPINIVTQGTDGTYGKALPANLPISYAVIDSLKLKKDATSTAVTSTVTLTNNGTTFTLSAFTGVIVNNSTVPATRTSVTFTGAVNVTPLYQLSLLYVDNTGTLQQANGATADLTQLQKVDNIYIGRVVFNSGFILALNLNPSIEYSIDNRFRNLGDKIRNINEGNNIGANGVNLQVNKGAGTTWRVGSNFTNDRKVPDETVDIAATPIPAGVNAIGYRNGSGGWTYEPFTGSITPTFWDNGTGTKATVANNKFTNHRVYFFNATDTYIIYLGRAEYSTLEAAKLEAEKPNSIVDPATSVASLIGTISVEKSCTALNNTALAAFTQGPRMQGGSSSGGTSGTQNLQSTYLNSLQPQITTSTVLGAVEIKRGSTSDTDDIFKGSNGAGTKTFGVTGNGALTALTYNGFTPENVANKQNSLAIDGTGGKYPTVDAVNTLKWINSDESLSLAQRKDDVLYGILDQYTGEEMTLSKVTGTPTVDGVIYFQLGAEYFKRNNSDIIDLRWFRADNILVQSMLGYSNVKYLVSRNFDLNGASITIPTGCSLIFKNGVFTNFASITGDFTKIEAGVTKIFDLSGTISGFTVAEAYPEWFGAFGNNSNNDYAPFQKCLTSFKKLYLSAKNYYVAGNLTATQDIMIVGKGANTVVTVGTTGEFLTLGDDTYLTDFGIGYYKNIISNFEINAESTVTTVIKSKGIRWVNYDLLTVRGGAVGIHVIGAFKMSSLRKVDLPHQTTTNCIIDYTNNFVLDQVGIFGNIGGTTGLKITSAVGQQCKNITLQACDFEGLSEAINVKGYDISNINILNSWFEGNTTDITFDNSLETLTSLNIDGGFFQGNIYLGTVDQTAGTKLINGVTIDNIQIENGDIYVRGATTVQDCSFGSAISFKGSGSIIYADAPHLINPGRGAELPAHDIMPRYTVQPEVAVSTSEVRSSQGEFRYNDNEVSVKTSKGWGFLPILYKEEFAFEALPDTSTIDLEGVNTGSFVGTTDLYNFTGEVQGHVYTLVGGVGCNKLIVHSDSSIKLVDGQNVRLLEGDIIAFQCIGASLVKEVYRNIAAYNFAPRISPAFTGTPTAPTATVGTNTTQIATTAFVQGIRPYKVYTALISQSGTSDPTVTVLENTLGGTIVWTRSGVGDYLGTLTGAFVSDKTYQAITNTNFTYEFTAIRLSVNAIIVATANNSATPVDGILSGTPIEIRVYN